MGIRKDICNKKIFNCTGRAAASVRKNFAEESAPEPVVLTLYRISIIFCLFVSLSPARGAAKMFFRPPPPPAAPARVVLFSFTATYVGVSNAMPARVVFIFFNYYTYKVNNYL